MVKVTKHKDGLKEGYPQITSKKHPMEYNHNMKVTKRTEDTIEMRVVSISEMEITLMRLDKGITALFNIVQSRTKVPRNSLCECGSGKRYKKCCKETHDDEAIRLEMMIKNYKELDIEINLRKEEEKKNEILRDKGQSKDR